MRPLEEGVRLAREAAAKALAIDPDYAPAHGRLGWIAMNFDADLAAAARHYEHALALDPANTDIIGNAATLAANLNRLDTAHRASTNTRPPATRSTPSAMQTWALPTSAPGAWTRPSPVSARCCAWPRGMPARMYEIGGGAATEGRGAGRVDGDAEGTRGDLAPARADDGLSHARPQSRLRCRARRVDQEVRRRRAYNIAYVLAWRNERDRAFEWLDKAVTQQDPGLSEIASSHCSPISTTILAGCRSCARSARRPSNSRRSSST